MASEKWLALLRSGKDSSLLRFSLGSDLFQEGRYGEAVEHLQVAVGLDARYSAAWKVLGRSLTALSRFAEARQAFETGITAATERGDKQAAKEMTVFLRRVDRAEEAAPGSIAADDAR
jgi:predicted Zn-dependent protease